VFTRALYWSLSRSRCIQSTSFHLTSPRSIIILSSYLRLDLPNGPFPSGFPTKILYAFLISLMRATCHIRLILFDIVIIIIMHRGICHSRPVPVQNFGYLVGFLGQGISKTQGLYLHRTTQHRKNADKHPCSERGSKPRSQCSSGRRNTCLRPRGHWDRLQVGMISLIIFGEAYKL
jgi:hypothetical protein